MTLENRPGTGSDQAQKKIKQLIPKWATNLPLGAQKLLFPKSFSAGERAITYESLKHDEALERLHHATVTPPQEELPEKAS